MKPPKQRDKSKSKNQKTGYKQDIERDNKIETSNNTSINNSEISNAPQKTKQMGNIDPDIKIYVEDYVYTYLYQYGKSDISEEKVALMVGKHYQLNGQDTVVISGAIIGKYSENVGGIEFFSEKSWEYIGAEMDKYFQGMVTVGWVHILEGSGGFYTDVHLKLHREFFKEEWQQIFIIDPSEKLDYFYSCNNKYLEQRNGYFIYYDKNKEMQEYMLDNSMAKEKVSVEEMDIYNRDISEDAIVNFETTETETAKKKFSIKDRLQDKSKIDVDNKDSETDENASHKQNENPSPLSDLKETSENLNSRVRKSSDRVNDIKSILKKRAKAVEETEKERHTMLVGASCSVCFLLLCMGVAVNNSVKRIDNLEGNFQTFQSSYENLSIKIQSAFATQQEEVVENEVIPTVATMSTTIDTDDIEINETHVVAEGETLAHISRIYYKTEYKVADIMEENNITNADYIYVGQKLRIP